MVNEPKMIWTKKKMQTIQRLVMNGICTDGWLTLKLDCSRASGLIGA
jgi:hypothetical protein